MKAIYLLQKLMEQYRKEKKICYMQIIYLERHVIGSYATILIGSKGVTIGTLSFTMICARDNDTLCKRVLPVPTTIRFTKLLACFCFYCYGLSKDTHIV